MVYLNSIVLLLIKASALQVNHQGVLHRGYASLINRHLRHRLDFYGLCAHTNRRTISSRPRLIQQYKLDTIDWAYTEQDMTRINESDDKQFYEKPKFQRHLDEWALLSLKQYYGKEIEEVGKKVNLLDLCSSWMSHLPDSCNLNKVLGVGMNAEELKANSQLTDFLVQDLNKQPFLTNIESESFEMVLMSCSVDYLTQPRILFSEIYRVLRPNGGTAIITFSNRYFKEKVVAVWLNAAGSQKVARRRNVNGERVDFECKRQEDYIINRARMDIVSNYIRSDGKWESIEAYDIKLDFSAENILRLVMEGPESLWRWFAFCIFRGTFQTDPIYAVKAVKR